MTLFTISVGYGRSLGNKCNDKAAMSTLGMERKKKSSIFATMSTNETETEDKSCLFL